MTPIEALRILTMAHTRDDDEIGYTVQSHRDRWLVSADEYAEAWGVVRKMLDPGDVVDTNNEIIARRTADLRADWVKASESYLDWVVSAEFVKSRAK